MADACCQTILDGEGGDLWRHAEPRDRDVEIASNQINNFNQISDGEQKLLHDVGIVLSGNSAGSGAMLHLAARFGQCFVIEYLVREAAVDINGLDLNRKTAMDLALQFGQRKSLQKLAHFGGKSSVEMEKDIAIAQRDAAQASISAASDRADAAMKNCIEAEDNAHLLQLEKKDLEVELGETQTALNLSNTKVDFLEDALQTMTSQRDLALKQVDEAQRLAQERERARDNAIKAYKLAEEYAKQMERERDKANHEQRNSVAIRDAAVAEKETAQLMASRWGDECRLLKVQLQRAEDERDRVIQEKFNSEKLIGKKVMEWNSMLDKYKNHMDKEARAAMYMRKRLKEKKQGYEKDLSDLEFRIGKMVNECFQSGQDVLLLTKKNALLDREYQKSTTKSERLQRQLNKTSKRLAALEEHLEDEIEKGVDHEIGGVMGRFTQIQSQMWVSIGRMQNHFTLFTDQLYATHTLQQDIRQGSSKYKKKSKKERERVQGLGFTSTSAASIYKPGQGQKYSFSTTTSSPSLPEVSTVNVDNMGSTVKEQQKGNGFVNKSSSSDLSLATIQSTPAQSNPIAAANEWMRAHNKTLELHERERALAGNGVDNSTRSTDCNNNNDGAGDSNSEREHEKSMSFVQVFWSKKRIEELLSHAEVMKGYMQSVVGNVEGIAEAIVKHSREEVLMWKRIVERKEGIIQTLLMQKKQMSKRVAAVGFRDCFIREHV